MILMKREILPLRISYEDMLQLREKFVFLYLKEVVMKHGNYE